ncbi:hypothetical protein PUR71_09010 [Streptomyces sp. SP17BM10]|uniref:hypothetical protein n=1 Tax=Streptomyces sp. SP17BM10 TaxID=3002530 RepID=UPI002E78767C|nr:hypothetical protein [Streptomyces sp. SP17BM10]MEE1783054.1 hypothetical protein [Streptomyces sp. SP17BM10]
MMSLGPLRGRIAVARGYVGRTATLATTAGLAAGALTTDPLPFAVTLGGAGAATAWGLIWSATLPSGRIRDAATALYLVAPAGAAGLLVTERLVHGLHWWELALDAAWAVATWKVRPARMARVLAGRERSLTPEAVQQVQEQQALVPAGSTHPMSIWWAQRVAVEGGVAPGTVLTDVERAGEKALTALIRAAVPGTPVPTISITALSALLDWDEEEIRVEKVAGRGAGVRRLHIGTADQVALDPYAHWVKNIAPKGMPGTVITGVRIIDTDTKELH